MMAGCLFVKEGDIDIYVLPEDAFCVYSAKSPTEMDECPLKRFDDCGMICRPSECEFYHECNDLDPEW